MILLWGLAEDPPLASLRDVLVAREIDHVFVDQRQGSTDPPDFGRLRAAYIRPFDYGDLPGISDDPDRVLALRQFAQQLTDWLETAPIPVVNRFSAQASNT